MGSSKAGVIGETVTEVDGFTVTCRCGATQTEVFLDWGATDCDIVFTCTACKHQTRFS